MSLHVVGRILNEKGVLWGFRCVETDTGKATDIPYTLAYEKTYNNSDYIYNLKLGDNGLSLLGATMESIGIVGETTTIAVLKEMQSYNTSIYMVSTSDGLCDKVDKRSLIDLSKLVTLTNATIVNQGGILYLRAKGFSKVDDNKAWEWSVLQDTKDDLSTAVDNEAGNTSGDAYYSYEITKNCVNIMDNDGNVVTSKIGFTDGNYIYIYDENPVQDYGKYFVIKFANIYNMFNGRVAIVDVKTMNTHNILLCDPNDNVEILENKDFIFAFVFRNNPELHQAYRVSKKTFKVIKIPMPTVDIGLDEPYIASLGNKNNTTILTLKTEKCTHRLGLCTETMRFNIVE